MKNLYVLMFVVLFSFTNNVSAQLTNAQKESIKKEVLKINEKEVSSMKLLDADAMSEFWSTEIISATVCWDSLINQYDSYEKFNKAVSNWFASRKSQVVTIKQVNAEVLKENLVLISEILHWDITWKNGFKQIGDSYVTILWKKGNKGWKSIYYHESVAN